jgi:DNA invertase Pin-like site-specific DNA recombinase
MTKTQTNRTGIAYLRVSTTEQGESGLGLEAQEAAVRSWASANGVELVEIVTEIESGKSLRKRPLLSQLLWRMAKGEAELLIASNVSRLARNVSDLAAMLDNAQSRGYGLVAIDTGLDTSTPAGRMVIQILGVAAEYERAMISDRTKRALAAARARGVELGRKPILEREIVSKIHSLRQTGKTYEAIAADLNAEGIATPTGKSWSDDLVRLTLKRNGLLEPSKRGRRPAQAA